MTEPVTSVARHDLGGDDQPESVVLSVRGLRKHFVLHNVDGRQVDGLDGIDLDVSAGEHVALAGSSG
ncbi:MAG: alpha-D-ribose 1-methylphosphonate 5-triphosphate synthase subunit PhnL, partial [Candidatus Aldehydirespiratoraceae bacterium]